MTIGLLFAAALALAPADRLQMADKMFAKGLYSDAIKEYAALRGEKTISETDLTFRIAECCRALGREGRHLAAQGLERPVRPAQLLGGAHASHIHATSAAVKSASRNATIDIQ